MSAHDCFELGRQTFLNEDYIHSAQWMFEARERLKNDAEMTNSELYADTLEFLAYTYYQNGKQ